MNKKNLFFALSFFSVSILFAQNIPNGYGGVNLGMTVEQTKKALKDNSDFGYRGDRDVSLLPGENRILIETEGFSGSFLERCWFQFYEEKLYSITVNVNREKIDHYSIFSTLCKKYGNPDTLNPEKSVWKSQSVMMSLERPLTLKYVDLQIFEKLQNKSTVSPSAQEVLREMFLDSL